MMRGARRPGTHVLIAALLGILRASVPFGCTPFILAVTVTGCQPAPTAKPTGLTPKKSIKSATNTAPATGRPGRDTTPGATGTPPNGPQTPAGPGGQAGSGTNPAPSLPPNTTATPSPSPTTSGGSSGGGSGGSSTPASFTGLTGLLTAPGRILSDTGASIVSNNGSRIISNNGSAIISNNGSAIISNNGSAYRLMAAETHKLVTNAFIYLTDRDEKYYLDGSGNVLATTVGSTGRYQYASGFPVGKDVVVNAVMNGNLRMAGFMVPGSGGGTLHLNLGSTMATEFLRGEAYRTDKGLGAFDQATFQQVAALSQQAVETGAIASVSTETDQTGAAVDVGRFDLRADHTGDLRNQYVIAFSAAAFGDTLLKQISDSWKALFGERPAAVTSLMGSGEEPYVETSVSGPAFLSVGFADGDTRDGSAPQTGQIALGYNYSVAVSKVASTFGGHNIFVGCATTKGNSGHIRWVRTDAAGAVKKVTTLWLPTYGVGHPLGICVEKDPTGDVANPGSLLVADAGTNKIYRVYLVDETIPNQTYYPNGGLTPPFDDDGNPGTPDAQVPFDIERHFIEIVAGENEPVYAPADPFVGYLSAAHPFAIHPPEGAAYQTVDYQSGDPLRSRWRASDEGARQYGIGTPAPFPARYAHLDQPYDVEVDELGNIYIADRINHRIRFIPSTAGLAAEGDKNFFEYQTPVLNGNQEIASLSGTKPQMVNGAIYTIAGNPLWDPPRTPAGSSGWFGEYGGDNGPAQLAKFDQPFALAWNNADKCLYVADFDNNRIRKISRDTGVVTTFAGNPQGAQRSNGQGDFDFAGGYSGDGGPATQAELSFPKGLAFDATSRLYIADSGNGLIRMVGADGVITTVAGRYHDPNGLPTDNADDGDARHYADLYETEKIDVDPQGNIVFNDYRHGRLRKLWRQWE